MEDIQTMKEEQTPVRNLFQDVATKAQNSNNNYARVIQNTQTDIIKTLTNYSLEELVAAIDKEYENEEDIDHSQEIAEYRNPIRIAKGKGIINPELISDWCDFVNHFGNAPVPYNYEIESILKYLVKFKEGIYSNEEIADQFIEEFKGLNEKTRLFILVFVAKFANQSVSFYYLVQKRIADQINLKKAQSFKEQKEDLIRRGISEKQAIPLLGVKMGKLLEDNHDLADIMLFPCGNMEGVDNEGNWIFMREIKTSNNETLIVLFKVNQGSTMRYIINKDTHEAIATDEKGTYKTKTTKRINIEKRPNMSITSLNDQIEYMITEIGVIGISHDKSTEIAEEMIELCNPVNDDTNMTKAEEIFNEELKRLNKNYK